MKTPANNLFTGCSQIFFLKAPLMGCLVFGMALVFPGMALAGLLSYFVSVALSRTTLDLDSPAEKRPGLIYNPVLVGLSIGYAFQVDIRVFVFILLMAGITFLVTVGFESVLNTVFKLPVLSLPFVICTWASYLIGARLNFLPAVHHTGHVLFESITFPFFVNGYFKSLGAVFFLPYALCGFFIALVIGYYSRILLFLSLAGYYTGTIATAFFTGAWQEGFAASHHYNFILTAMSLGGMFLLPRPRTLLIVIPAVCASSLFILGTQGLLQKMGLQALTLPFNITTLGFAYFLTISRYPDLVSIVKGTPEETLNYHMTTSHRVKSTLPSIGLPFSGVWHVWQGTKGSWTHQGRFEHAVDFLIKDEQGKSFADSGIYLTDYYCFGRQVLSPVSGFVRRVVNVLPDNIIGQVDKINNWGNLIVIESDQGVFVEISHLLQHSITVYEGSRVEKGMVIAACGNSGYSPQPHLHVQVQENASMGSATRPFVFESFFENSRCRSHCLPKEDRFVESLGLPHQQRIGKTYLLDDEIRFNISKNQRRIGKLNLKVKMDENGATYFDSKKGRLYFTETAGFFYFLSCHGKDSCLKLLSQTFPGFPLFLRPGVSWQEKITAPEPASRFSKWKSFFPDFFRSFKTKKTVRFTCDRPYRVSGRWVTKTGKSRDTFHIQWNAQGDILEIKIHDMVFSGRLDTDFQKDLPTHWQWVGSTEHQICVGENQGE